MTEGKSISQIVNEVFVKAKYPNAICETWIDGEVTICVINLKHGQSNHVLGTGDTELEAWEDAAGVLGG